MNLGAGLYATRYATNATGTRPSCFAFQLVKPASCSFAPGSMTFLLLTTSPMTFIRSDESLKTVVESLLDSLSTRSQSSTVQQLAGD